MKLVIEGSESEIIRILKKALDKEVDPFNFPYAPDPWDPNSIYVEKPITWVWNSSGDTTQREEY